MIARDVPVGGGRSLSAAPPKRFDLLGVHWRGSGAVLYSTRSVAGRWSAWQTADADQYPDRGGSENRLAGWRLGGLAWVGPATAARFRLRGSVTRLRAYYVESTIEDSPVRRLSIAGSPPIIPRSGWNANEAIRRAKPRYADAVHFAVVHHTAGSNAYTPAESAAIVRGIELYHVQGNGWDDIGYNFLVDKYGQIFEGRYGGIDRPVIGAHAQGFNTGSVGVAVLGDYGATPISTAARRALVRLLAWRLDVVHVDPLSTLTWLSGGNPRFPAGVPVFLRAISGHRDTNFTDCPGNALYAQLPEIAREVSLAGTPKLYAPEVSGRLGGLVSFTGRLSGEAQWAVTIADGAGVAVATRNGTGPRLDWTWDSSAAVPGSYTWAITGASLRGASGSLGTKKATATLALQGAIVSPAVVAPGGEPADDDASIAYVLTRAATVTATVVGASGTVGTIVSGPQSAGKQTLTYVPPASLAPGSYQVILEALASDGTTASTSVPFVVDPTLAGFALSEPSLSLVRPGTLGISFTLAGAPVEARLEILRGEKVVATPAEDTLDAGTQVVDWDGTLADGTRAPDGAYTVRLTVTDPITTFTRSLPLTVDSTPPSLTVVSARAMRFRLSETATVTLGVGRRRYTRVRPAGPFHFWLEKRPYAYRVVVVDPAGNRFAHLYHTR
jgi:N-acetylmuramoyl-L-alanine amidase/FlgD Ig-like domain